MPSKQRKIAMMGYRSVGTVYLFDMRYILRLTYCCDVMFYKKNIYR